jgi:hypothetical protein
MAEDFELRTPRDADQRDSTSLGGSHGKRGRGGNGDHDAGADGCRLLNHLDGNPAGEDDGAAIAGHTFRCKRTGQLVRRIVPPYVLAGNNQALTRRIESGRVGCPCRPIEALRIRKRCDRLFNLAGR